MSPDDFLRDVASRGADAAAAVKELAPDPVTKAALKALEKALGRVAGREELDQRAADLERLQSALRQRSSGAEDLATRLRDLVAAEVAAVDTGSFEHADIAKTILVAAVEGGAGVLFDALQSESGLPEAAVLRNRLELFFLTPDLASLFGDDAPDIARWLTARVLLAVRSLPAYHHEVTQRNHAEQARRLEEVNSVVLQILAALQPVTDEHVEALLEANWAAVELRSWEAVQRRLSLGLRGRDVAKEVAPLTPLLSRLVSRRDRPGAEQEWVRTTLGEVAAELSSRPCRALLVGRAGFGKTTALHLLALELAAKRQVMPLRVVEPGAWRRLVALTGLALARTSVDFVELPDEWPESAGGGAAIAQLARRGRVVVLVDGLDRLGGGLERFMGETLQAARDGVSVVAACREEVTSSDYLARCDLVIRLDGVDLDATDATQLPPDVRAALEAHFDAEDRHNPLWVHAARALAHAGRLPSRGRGLAAFVRAYLDTLFALATEHDEVRDLRSTATRAVRRERLRLLASTIALDGLRFREVSRRMLGPRSDGSSVDEQAPAGDDSPLVGEVPEVVLLAAVERARSEGGLDQSVADQLVTDLETQVALLRAGDAGHHLDVIGEASTSPSGPVFVFHHQLLQEFLAAEGLVGALEALPDDGRDAGAAARRLEEITADVVQPRLLGRQGRAGAGGDEITNRVTGLSFWRFVAELLVGDGSPLSPDGRLELIRRLTSRLWGNGLGRPDLPGACRSALLRLRDELVECEDDAAAPHAGSAPEGHNDPDPVLAQFSAVASAPDPFVLACWSEEKDELRAQLERWLDGRPLQAVRPPWAVDLRRVPDESGWILEAADKRGEVWLLVPPGPFIAGSHEGSDEMPVRVESTRDPFWIAKDPVTVKGFARFLAVQGGAYNLGRPWWQRLGVGARESQRGRGEPSRWKEQQQRVDRPVVEVNWFEAAAYCLWLGESSSSCCARLPTGLEWEKAARGLYGRRWPWGCAWRAGLAVVLKRGGSRDDLATPEANRNISPSGIRGMAGNVWEWTSTVWVGGDAEGTVWPGSGLPDVGRIADHTSFEQRSGAFDDLRSNARCAYRSGDVAWGGYHSFGFRCARDVG